MITWRPDIYHMQCWRDTKRTQKKSQPSRHDCSTAREGRRENTMRYIIGKFSLEYFIAPPAPDVIIIIIIIIIGR